MAVLFILAVFATASAVNVPKDFRNDKLQLKVLALTGMVERMQSQFDDLQKQHRHLEIKLAGLSEGRNNARHETEASEPPIVDDNPELQTSPDGYAAVKTNKRSLYNPTFSLTNHWNGTINSDVGPPGPKREPGIRGLQGAVGRDGRIGAKGDTGLTGHKGEPGVQGAKGINGVAPPSQTHKQHVAFHVARSTNKVYHNDDIVVYDHVKLDHGNGYHKGSGIYIAPESGTYVITWTSL